MRILLKKELSAKVWRLAGPVLLGMISQTLMGVIDTAMVGRLGPAELAATGLGGLLTWLVMGTLGGLNMGVQAITARRTGEGETNAAGRVLDNGLVIAFFVGIVCSVVLSVFVSNLFKHFTSDQTVVVAGQGYMFYRLLGGLPYMIITAHRGFFNGIGKTRLHMRVVILVNIVNVFLNYCLIFGKLGMPRLEAPGAGLATAIATLVGAIYFIIISLNFKSRKLYGYYSFSNVSLRICRNIIDLAIPAGLQVFLAMTGYAAFSAIGARIGIIELATTNVCITIWSLAFLPGAGLGVAAASLIGQKLGERDPGKAEEFGWESARIGIIVMGSLGLIFIAIPELIFRIFTTDTAVIQAGKIPLIILGIVQIFDATGMVLGHALQGAGMNKWVLKAEILLCWGLFVPLTALVVLVLNLGHNTAWMVLGFYLICYGTAVTSKFAGGKWKEVKI